MKKVALILAPALAGLLTALVIWHFTISPKEVIECRASMGTIQIMKVRWAMIAHKPDSASVTWNDLRLNDGTDLRDVLRCPCGGTYMLGKVGEPVTCSICTRGTDRRHAIDIRDYTRDKLLDKLEKYGLSPAT